MTFNAMTVKEILDNPKTAEIVKQVAPALLKFPLKPFHNKNAAELIATVVGKGIIPQAVATQLEAKINEVLK